MFYESMPKVLICLCICNGEKWIREQLISIIYQKDVLIELLISFDNCTDNSFFILDTILNLYKNEIKYNYYFVEFNSATLSFLNLITKSNSINYDYLCLSDQDDVWFSYKISNGINALINSKSSCYSSDITAFWSDSKFKIKYIKKSYKQNLYDFLFESPGPGCTFIMDKKFINIFTFFLKEKNLILPDSFRGQHDWFIYAFARIHSFSWFIDTNSYIYYRQHSNNLFGVNLGFNGFKKRVLLISSGWYLLISKTFASIFLKSSHPLFKAFINADINYLILIKNFYYLRRKNIDRIFLLLFLLLLYLKDILTRLIIKKIQ